jgi:serpin B
VAAVGASLVAGTVSAGAAPTSRQGDATLPAAAVAQDEEAFALDILGRLSSPQANLVLSPSSLDVLLAMLEPGAAGPTEQGIAAALHSPALSAGGQAAGWRGLAHHFSAAARAGGSVLDVANRAWLQDGLPVLPSYLRVLSDDFAAGVQEEDLAHAPAQAARDINSWVAGHTGGHITKLLSPALLQGCVAVLVDAVYFKAEWQTPFDPALTAPAPFHTAANQSVKVPFMSTSQPLSVPVSVSPALDALELPYKNGKFTAEILMPRSGDLEQFVQNLAPARLAQVTEQLRQQRVALELPRVSLADDMRLDKPLSAMGMGLAFSDNADFSGLSPRPLKVSFVVQDAQLKVTEKGTEASAASGAGLQPTAVQAPPPLSVVVDRPFLFLVRDVSTGAVLFEAAVADPAKS